MKKSEYPIKDFLLLTALGFFGAGFGSHKLKMFLQMKKKHKKKIDNFFNGK